MSLNYEIDNYDEKILQEFDTFCSQNDIWYSLSGITLLNAFSEKEYTTDKKIIEVMMTGESYKNFFNLYKNNILDTLNRSDFFLMNPYFYLPEFHSYIKINILIPANIKKTEKIYSIRNLVRQNIGFYKTNLAIEGFKNKIKKVFFGFMSFFWSPLTWEEISAKIYDSTNDGYFLVDSFRKNINQNWIHSLTMKTRRIKYKNVEVSVIDEYEIYLKKKYGFHWNKYPNIDKHSIDYIFLNKYIKH